MELYNTGAARQFAFYVPLDVPTPGVIADGDDCQPRNLSTVTLNLYHYFNCQKGAFSKAIGGKIRPSRRGTANRTLVTLNFKLSYPEVYVS